MYKGMAYRAYFDAVEAILRAYSGRPHWGKLHSLTARELQPLYPRWDEFQAVRRRLDPDGLFLNPYLRTIFGAT
jgi:FAD/FMN-containing dehydrogenase